MRSRKIRGENVEHRVTFMYTARMGEKVLAKRDWEEEGRKDEMRRE